MRPARVWCRRALLEALRVWPEYPPRAPRAWLTAVRPGASEDGDDTLFVLFCCCHPDLTPASQVALTLRASAA